MSFVSNLRSIMIMKTKETPNKDDSNDGPFRVSETYRLMVRRNFGPSLQNI